MLVFAYDGSIHGDWVSHYAVQLAHADPERRLRLVHVQARHPPDPRRPGAASAAPPIETKLDWLRAECARRGVDLDVRLVAASAGDRLGPILDAIPRHPGQHLLCGTPARGALRGSLAARLLAAAPCDALAIRVVQPGLLGAPRRLLLPFGEDADAADAGTLALPFLRLFEPQITQLHLLSVRRVGRRRLHRLTQAHSERLRGPGRASCARVERHLNEQLGLGARVRDAQAIVSDRIAREILVAANRTRSRLVYMAVAEPRWLERILYGDPCDQVLRWATCDVALYRDGRR